MGIGTMLKQRSYRKKVRDWPEQPGCLLELQLAPPVLNGIGFGNPIDEARSFGRPEGIVVIDSGRSVRLDFAHQGLILEYEHDRLVYIGLVVSPEGNLSSRSYMTPARAVLIHGERLSLSNETGAERIIGVLGPPADDDIDDDERVLTHQVQEYTVESEFTLQGRLKRFNVFPT